MAKTPTQAPTVAAHSAIVAPSVIQIAFPNPIVIVPSVALCTRDFATAARMMSIRKTMVVRIAAREAMIVVRREVTRCTRKTAWRERRKAINVKTQATG